MHRLVAALAAFFFAASAAAADLADKNYSGDDAGYLVMAISHSKSGIDLGRLFLTFRKTDRSETGYVEYSVPKSFLGIPSPNSTPADFTTEDETGIVVVRSLPPGEYEFVQCTVLSTSLHNQGLSRVHYSLPFTIKQKETTYLGNFRLFDKLRVGNFAATAGSGYYFIVTDKADRDLEIALRKPTPPSGPVTASVPEASKLNVPLFRSEIDPVITTGESLSQYDDARFAMGLPNNASSTARAMTGFTTAISRGDLWSYYQVEAFNSRGILHLQARHLDEAMADFSHAIAIDPFAFAAYSNRGAVYRARGEFDLAIADQTKALSFFPDYALAYIRRATTYFAGKKLDLALSDINEAIRLEPDNAFVYVGRGAVYREQGKLELAIADYSKAIEMKRYDEIIYEHYNARGFLFLETDQYEKAFADFDKVLYGRTGIAENYAGRCLALLGMGNAQRALRDCDKALSLKPNQAGALHSRGLAYFKLGQYARALDDFSTAFRLDPSNAGALYGRGLAKAKAGDTAAGTSDVDQAKSMNPNIAATMAKFGVSP